MPNLDQVTALLRAVLSIVGTLLTANGTVSSTLWQQITGSIILLVPVVWSMFVHSDAGKLAAVAAMPEVRKIEVDPVGDTAVAAAASDILQPKIVAR